MTTVLLPPRGAWIERDIIYHKGLPEKAGWFYVQIKGLAWQGRGKTTPWISMSELIEITGRQKTAIYGYMTTLRTINALRWQTSGDGRFMFSFPLADSAIPEMPDSSSALIQESTDSVDLEAEDTPQFRISGMANVYEAYQNNIGLLTPMISDALRDAETTYTPAWVVAAIAEAVRSNARSMKYVEAILKRWAREGFQAPKAPGKGDGKQSAADNLAEYAKQLEVQA